MSRKIDPTTWPRKQVFDFFSGVSNPFYMVTFRLDVTKLKDYTKQRDISFYYALVYLCTKCVNKVEAFHYAIRDGEVFYLEERNPSFTDMKKDSELFHIVTMDCEGSLDEFCREARERSMAQDCFIQAEKETDELIYFSCLPWLDMTAMTNERDLNAPTAKDVAIPTIAWGKYVETDGKFELGMSIEVNHRLIDGYHIGQFAQELEKSIDMLY